MNSFDLSRTVAVKLFVKFVVICWWCAVIGTYVWFLSYMPKASLWVGWLSVVTATLLGGAGMNHITNLYKIPLKDFELAFAWPVFYMSFGAIVIILGVLLGALYQEIKWAQILSICYVVVGVFFFVWGSDTAPLSSS